MAGIKDYSTTQANNTSLNGISTAEGMLPSNLNNAIRALMKNTREWFNDSQWVEYGDGDAAFTAAYASANSFTIAGVDVTAIYHAGRRIKLTATTPGTIYGTISSSTFSTNTTVNVTWDSGSLSSEAITNVYIGALSKTNSSIPTGIIGTSNIADNAITTAKIADSQITVAKMTTNSVDSDQYVDGSIDTIHIADSNITVAKMAANSVDSDQYVDGSIDTIHIGDDQITTAKIPDSAITSAKILDGAIVDADINAAAAISLSKLENLTTARALVSDGSGDVSVSDVTSTEVGYLDGVSSAIQTQIDAKQDSDADLTAIAALAKTDGNLIVGNGSTWVAESGSTARTSLGLGTISTQASDNVSLTGGSITGLGEPSSNSDASTKSYVDQAVAGLRTRIIAEAATTGNIDLTADLQNADTIDGVTLVTGDRVLVKDQTDTTANGLYIAVASGAASRDPEHDTIAELSGGMVVVNQGTANDNKIFLCTTNSDGSLGSTSITYTVVTPSNSGTVTSITAGTGLSGGTITSAGTIAIDTATTVDKTTAQTLTNKTLTSPKINEDVAVTSTATELNLLDGVSGLVQADFTKLAAIDATADEIDTLDGLSRGSIIYGNASAATTVLTKGTVGQVLTSDGTDIAWGNISGGTSWQSVKTSGFTAVAGEGYPCNTTSSAFTVTLPSSPSIGDYVVIADYGNNASSNNIIIDGNGSKILGTSGNRKIQTNKEAIKLVYIDATKGWIAASGYVEGTLGLQGVPDAPTIGTATQTGNTTATVAFTAPTNNGDATITSYTSTSTPGGITNTLSQAGSGTISVTGLTGGTSYTFTVTATNSIGTSSASSASNSITTTNTYSADFLVIAGGGSGGGQYGGGGGAGGYRASYDSETSGGGGSSESSLTFSGGTVYTITVGAGGAGVTSNQNDGIDSSLSGSGITTITSIGGGGGGSRVGRSGGSGGGSGYNSPGGGGSGTANQGYNGGSSTATSDPYPSAGGGGAGAVGNNGGDGGNGVSSSIDGSATTRAGGGGGSSYSTGGSGGTGGGGAGSSEFTNGGNATVNTGSGGGGCNAGAATSGSGGSGLVILRMPTANYSGTTTGSPTPSTDGTDTILTYTGDGSYTG